MDNNKKIYLTKEGLAELKKEYDDLVNIKRPDILSRVSQARNMGDLSENAEYVAAREELTFIDGRIDELEVILKDAVLIRDTVKASAHAIKLGSTVTLHTNGKKEIFTVVGEWEADPMNKKISHESPLGKVLLGKKVGEKVQVEAPAGKITYSIIGIK
jgi:transcription elongation factor GreA